MNELSWKIQVKMMKVGRSHKVGHGVMVCPERHDGIDQSISDSFPSRKYAGTIERFLPQQNCRHALDALSFAPFVEMHSFTSWKLRETEFLHHPSHSLHSSPSQESVAHAANRHPQSGRQRPTSRTHSRKEGPLTKVDTQSCSISIVLE